MFACVPDVAHANEVLLSLTRSTSKCVAMSPFVVHASKRDREMTCAAQAARGGAGGVKKNKGPAGLHKQEPSPFTR